MDREDEYYQAMLARDPRFDGKFFASARLADTDAFPATDMVLQRAVAKDPGLDPVAVRPWRGYAAAHLWRAWSAAREGGLEKK